MAARGAPEAAANIALGLYAASRNGEFATSNLALEQLLCHKLTNMRELIAEKLTGLGTV